MDSFAFCPSCYNTAFNLRLDYGNKKRVPMCVKCGKELED